MDDSFQVKSLDGLTKMNYIDIKEEEKQEVFNMLPPLVKAYIKFGAKFSHDPFVDYEFKSVDVFVFVDNSTGDSEFTNKLINR